LIEKWFLAAAAVLAFSPAMAAAQTSVPIVPSYVVSTVRPSNPASSPDNDDIGFDSRSGEFNTVNQTLRDIIKFAYDLSPNAEKHVVGGPTWASSAKFDILAKTDAETFSALQKLTGKEKLEEVRQMVRGLLAERFKLKVHREARELPVYALIVMKNGSKLTPMSTPPKSERINGALPGHLECIGCTMNLFSNVLAGEAEIGGRLVIDRTELTGYFNFLLRWTPDPTMGVSPPGRDGGVAPDPSAPSFFTAIEEQLGLRLKMAKGPVDTIVIDSVETPSPN
jgi:uncharacterized protein (TIGR03435 family)